MGSILRAVQLPAVGGDTCFASMYAAYEGLSPPMRDFVDGLRAVHDITNPLKKAIRDGHSTLDLGAMQEKCPPVEHNVVVTHPETGRKALFVNRNSTTHIVGLTDREQRRAAAVPVRPRALARVPVPVPLGSRVDRVLGQPRGAALRGRRLPRAARHAPRRRSPGPVGRADDRVRLRGALPLGAGRGRAVHAAARASGCSSTRSSTAASTRSGCLFIDYSVLRVLELVGPPHRMSPTELSRDPGAVERRHDPDPRPARAARGSWPAAPDPDDRRKVLVELTDEGLRTADDANATYARERERLLEGLSSDEIDRLDDAVSRLLEVLTAPQPRPSRPQPGPSVVRGVSVTPD